MSYRIVVELFDTARAVHERRSLRTYDPAVLSLDTKSGLPPDLDKAARSLRTARVPKDIFEKLESLEPVEETRVEQERQPSRRALDPSAPAFTFSSFKSALPPVSPRLKNREFPSLLSIAPPFTPLRPLDWRFGPISIEWQETDQTEEISKNNNEMASNPWLPEPTPQIPAISRRDSEGSSSSRIDVGFGVIHLYRDLPKTQSEQQQYSADANGGGSSKQLEEAAELEKNEDEDQDGDVILAILAIPPVWSVADLLKFVAPSLSAEAISHIRILR
jgi:hypothetical protein